MLCILGPRKIAAVDVESKPISLETAMVIVSCLIEKHQLHVNLVINVIIVISKIDSTGAFSCTPSLNNALKCNRELCLFS